MGQPVNRDGLEPWIAEDYFRRSFACRVAVEGGLNIGRELAPQARQALQEEHRLRLAEGFVIVIVVAIVGRAGFVAQRPPDLLRQAIVEAVHDIADIVGDVPAVETLPAAVAGGRGSP